MMSKTRDNHFVPQWYQEGFFQAGHSKYRYLDLSPKTTTLPNGKSFTAKHRFTSATSQCFYQTDLYTTFFGSSINDEIERKLFGGIDDWGSKAVRAYISEDGSLQHKHFRDLFEYIDAQKFRTPKGLDWLRAHYPRLDQNDLMMEMQGIQRMNCTIWSEGIREIVSAEAADIGFIVSDHPVTVYNYALAPDCDLCAYPNDPSVALKATQTLFPLNKDFCLIFTNLEYANDPDGVSPIEKRTFARNYRNSMVRTDAFIRSRQLDNAEVARINYILKARARRYIAAAEEEWLYPEKLVDVGWADLRSTILPPEEGRWKFGGELIAKFESGEVHYQDQFGRTEKPREFLQKKVSEAELGPNDACGCGSNKKFRKCCKGKPKALRPTWAEKSIRERNIIHCRAIADILGLSRGKDWVDVRRDLTGDQISRIYSIYEALWPLETDILSLLPKPDGTARALYTGVIDPRMMAEFVIGSGLYFGEIMIENPFLHPGTVKKEFNPIEHPEMYHQDFLKGAFLLISLMPLIEDGVVNLFPDPCNFDRHLREQMMQLAETRLKRSRVDLDDDPRTKWMMFDDFKRSMSALPEDVRRRQIKKALPDTDDALIELILAHQTQNRERDPFAAISDDMVKPGKGGGMLQMIKMAPNFEMAIYLARATGSFIFTDSKYRWGELLASQQDAAKSNAAGFCASIAAKEHLFVRDPEAVSTLRLQGCLGSYRDVVRDLYAYLLSIESRGVREKQAAQIASRFSAVHAASQNTLRRTPVTLSVGRMHCIAPQCGLTHNNVSRMLITSGVENHLKQVPMAFYMETTTPEIYSQEWA